MSDLIVWFKRQDNKSEFKLKNIIGEGMKISTRHLAPYDIGDIITDYFFSTKNC
jgi:hypothetical protein